jgi:hypothetical protein
MNPLLALALVVFVLVGPLVAVWLYEHTLGRSNPEGPPRATRRTS